MERSKLVRKNIEYILLRCLNEKAMHGYAIINQVRKDHGVYLGPSTVYPTLNQLEEQGLIKGLWDLTSVRPRKTYEITSEGLREFQREKTVIRQMLEITV